MGSETVQEKHGEDLEKDDLELFLDELATYYGDYQLQPGEFTVNCLLDRMNGDTDRSSILKDLRRRAKAGELEAKQEKVKGRRMWVFRR